MSEALIVVERLRKVFDLGHGDELVAVDDVSFTLAPGASMAIVGESGSGKTTVARLLVGLETSTSGRITVDGVDVSGARTAARERRRRARSVQIVFQDPYTSLDPRQHVANCLDESLRLHTDLDGEGRRDRVHDLLRRVGMDDGHGAALPSRLSGGQRQRVAIARALACEPRVLVLDEAVSALDVSIQGQILNLLNEIRASTGISYVFISHDLAVVRQVTDDVMVMRRGQVVEHGPTGEVLDRPAHPYTQLLRASVPGPGWTPERARDLLSALDRDDH
jgi:ABC-type glutathione transport system ATPase component